MNGEPIPDESEPTLIEATFREEAPDHAADAMLVSLLRLSIGSAEMGVNELAQRLREWEKEVHRLEVAAENEHHPTGQDSQVEERQADRLRYALIGWLFESVEKAGKRASRINRVIGLLNDLSEPWLKPLRRSRLLRPARGEYQRWVHRGESEVSRWIELGRKEDQHSRRLAQVALKTTVDKNIEYLTTNPEVQELVQTQSTGLATEVVEEVRERAVSADEFIEQVFRSLLRRAPRQELPEPPEPVREAVAPRRTRAKNPK